MRVVHFAQRHRLNCVSVVWGKALVQVPLTAMLTVMYCLMGVFSILDGSRTVELPHPPLEWPA